MQNNMRPLQYFAFSFGHMSDFFLTDLPFTGKKKINKSRPLKVFYHILFIASTLMLSQRELDPDKKP